MGEVNFESLGLDMAEPTAGESSVEGDQVLSDESGIQEEPEPSQTESEGEVTTEEAVENINYDDMSPREKAMFEEIKRLSSQQATPAAPETPQTQQAKVEEAIYNYFEGQDIDDVFSNADNINRLLNTHGNRIIETAVNRAQEAIMKNLTGVFTHHLRQQLEARDVANEWLDANPDMKQCRELLGKIGSEIAADNPEMSIRQVFDESAKRIRTMLRAQKVVPAKKPAFANSGRGGAVNRTRPQIDNGIAAQIEELL